MAGTPQPGGRAHRPGCSWVQAGPRVKAGTWMQAGTRPRGQLGGTGRDGGTGRQSSHCWDGGEGLCRPWELGEHPTAPLPHGPGSPMHPPCTPPCAPLAPPPTGPAPLGLLLPVQTPPPSSHLPLAGESDNQLHLPHPFLSPQRPYTAILAGISQLESRLLKGAPSATQGGPYWPLAGWLGWGSHVGGGREAAELGGHHGGAGVAQPAWPGAALTVPGCWPWWRPSTGKRLPWWRQRRQRGPGGESCPGCAGSWRPSGAAAMSWSCPSPCAGTAAPGRWCGAGRPSTASTAYPAKGVRQGAAAPLRASPSLPRSTYGARLGSPPPGLGSGETE